MDSDHIIVTPVDDYELLDFGEGRKLERFGPYVLERPDLLATGARQRKAWEPDWVYRDAAVAGRWRATRPGLPREWAVRMDGVRQYVTLRDDGELGVYPEQLACWRWINERLSGCYHLNEINVLVLFGGAGGATAASLQAGAGVTHVEGDARAMERARRNLHGKEVEWVHDNVSSFVDRAIRQNQRYDMVILRPPVVQRGPGRQSWDLYCGDLESLLSKLPRLLSRHCRGIWLAPRDRDLSASSLEGMLRSILPGCNTRGMELGLALQDGDLLRAEYAACWFDDEEFLRDSGAMPSMDVGRMEEQLDIYLEPVLSSRRTAAQPARELSNFERTQQELVIRWVEVITRTNAEMAFQFAANASRALELMDEATLEAWVIQAMDAYDRRGLHAGIAELRDVERFAQEASQRDSGVVFDDISGVLELFVHGLGGRKLKLVSASEVYTDSASLHLPAVISRFAGKQDNFRCYKAMAVFQWAQTWFDSYRVSLQEELQRYDDYDHALACFSLLEGVRLDACIARAFPGLSREIGMLAAEMGEAGYSREFESLLQPLRLADADVHTSLGLIDAIYPASLPLPRYHHGIFAPERVEAIRTERIAREKKEFRTLLARMMDESRRRRLESGAELQQGEQEETPAFRVAEKEQGVDDGVYELLLDGQPMEIPAEAKNLVASIIQDLGEIPPEYLEAAGEGAYHFDRQEEDKSAGVWEGVYHEEGAFLYNEWDYRRKHYRKEWCVVREIDVPIRSSEFVDATLQKYRGLVKNIRHTFEALRGEDKVLKKQPYGDDIDIDAIVEAYGDMHGGMEMSERLFTKRTKLERNIAVMFMVDMSGSTKGWINDAERESLVLLCEALEMMGDRYAIYGFSGTTRKRCELYRVKGFDDSYNEQVKGRISGIEPRDYTRMGVTIRHLSKLLNEVEARTKLLITLSDGKPDDYDGYRGEYGIEDTRMALIEAKRDGIHPFCITIDREANDYLPHMYGAVNYTVIDEVRKLPLRVSDIYRKLTT